MAFLSSQGTLGYLCTGLTFSVLILSLNFKLNENNKVFTIILNNSNNNSKKVLYKQQHNKKNQ